MAKDKKPADSAATEGTKPKSEPQAAGNPKIEIGDAPAPEEPAKPEMSDLPGPQTWEIISNRALRVNGVTLPANTKLGELTTQFGLPSLFVIGGVDRIAFCRPKE